MLNRKAQVYITDFIVGLLIFSVGAILATRFIMHAMSPDDFSAIQSQAESASQFLLTEGVPNNWTNETVVRLGLVSNDRLNSTKVSNLHNLSYEDAQLALNLNYDFYLFFQENNMLNINGCGYGALNLSNCSINLSGIEYDDLVKNTRFVIYNGSMIEMVLYVWK